MKLNDYLKKHDIDLTKPLDVPFELACLAEEIRIIAGITQSELAKRMGTKQESISRAESGSIELSVSFLKRMADAAGVEFVMPRVKKKRTI